MTNHKKLSVNISFIPNISKVPKTYSKWMKENMHTDSSTTLRRDTKTAMNRINYMNEYDRIKGVLDQTIQHGHHDFKRLQNRAHELKALYHESFFPGINSGKHDFLKK
jgi:hypothetical protein